MKSGLHVNWTQSATTNSVSPSNFSLKLMESPQRMDQTIDSVDMVDIPLDGSSEPPKPVSQIPRTKTPPVFSKPIDNFDFKLVPHILKYLAPSELAVIQTACW